MKSSCQTETGHLACRWSDLVQPAEYDRYNTRFIQETSEFQGSYLPPLPDFASHSPFGGASWFLPRSVDQDFQ